MTFEELDEAVLRISEAANKPEWRSGGQQVAIDRLKSVIEAAVADERLRCERIATFESNSSVILRRIRSGD
jgi:hypothetical protein